MHQTHSLRTLLIAAAALLAPAGAQAQPAPFKVLITELYQLGPSFDLTGAVGDFYARVSIDGVVFDSDPSCSNSFSGALVPLLMFRNFSRGPDCFRVTPWMFTRELTPGTDPVKDLERGAHLFEVLLQGSRCIVAHCECGLATRKNVTRARESQSFSRARASPTPSCSRR